MTHTPTRPRTGTVTALRTVQVVAGLTVLELLWQFATAGRMVGPIPDHTARELHETGAVVLHVLTGLLTVGAIWWWREHRERVWVPVLAAVVFVLSFVQASLGDEETLWLHVPVSLVLTAGSVWVLAWSFTASARSRM